MYNHIDDPYRASNKQAMSFLAHMLMMSILLFTILCKQKDKNLFQNSTVNQTLTEYLNSG